MMRGVVPFLETPRATIEYEVRGRGPAIVVLVHGNFASTRWWGPLFERLRPGVRMFAPALRGFGRTVAKEAGHDVPALARDLRDFIDALALPRVHLVGHSLGGAVALELALAAPERVASLALISPAPAEGMGPMREGDGALARLLRWFPAEVSVSRFALLLTLEMSRWYGAHRAGLRAALLEMLSGADLPGPELEALVEDAARVEPSTIVGLYAGLERWNVESRLSELKTPVLLVAGRRDKIVPLPALERMAGQLSSGELVVLDEVGHSPQLERPREFAELFHRFLGRRVPWLRLYWFVLSVVERVLGALGRGRCIHPSVPR
jgi:branched-chain amino acid transport system permease protein